MNYNKTKISVLIACAIMVSNPVFADDITDLKAEVAQMKADYEQRIQQLEQRLVKAENETKAVQTEVAVVKATPPPKVPQRSNSFNPAISMVLNGQFSGYSKNPADYLLNGFSLQEEAGLATKGFSLGESELTFSANIDQLLAGQATFSLADDNGNTSVSVEEAFIETLGLGHGLTLRAGRFFSPIGYLNERHAHAWNFSDAPLIYRGLFGDQLSTDGLKLSYILPTDQLIELGGTVGNGNHYPGNGTHSDVGDWLVYAKTGGDIGFSHSWQASAAYWQSTPKDRAIGNGSSAVTFSGDTDISNLSFIYKWAPNGNPYQHNFTLLTEYFYAHDNGKLIQGGSTNYNGKQYGGYIEGIYQFIPHWRTGLRYDQLGSSLKASNIGFIQNANLNMSGDKPQRYSAMVEWLPSEFSRVRAQIDYDKSFNGNNDTQFFLQYTVNIGSHGAHTY